MTRPIYQHFEREADALGRSRTWHVGLYLEALGNVDKQLTPEERARLDTMLRTDPGQLLDPIRAALAPKP